MSNFPGLNMETERQMEARQRDRSRLEDLRHQWDRYRGVTIRVALALIVVLSIAAQFIPPLGDVLSRSRFLGTGLITAIVLIVFDALMSSDSGGSTGDTSLVLHRMSDLGDELQQTFANGVVELDIVAYSGETYLNVLEELFRDVLESGEKTNLRRLRIRMLLPDCTIKMPVPSLVGSDFEEDSDFKREIQERNVRTVRHFNSEAMKLRQLSVVEESSFDVRVHRFAPLFKYIIINNQTAFFALYPINPVRIRGLELWDYRGQQVRMVRCSRSTRSEREKLRSLREWFDVVWSGLSRPMPPP